MKILFISLIIFGFHVSYKIQQNKFIKKEKYRSVLKFVDFLSQAIIY